MICSDVISSASASEIRPALELDPGNPRTIERLGRLAWEAQQPNEARERWRQFAAASERLESLRYRPVASFTAMAMGRACVVGIAL